MALAVALMSATATSQLPEFSQQYRQRLGGAIDALERVKLSFSADANAFGMSVSEALEYMRDSDNAFVRKRAESMALSFARLDRLKRQRQAMLSAGPFGRIVVMLEEPDRQLSSAAWKDFEPAVPVTQEAFIIGGFGFLLGYLVFYGGVGAGRAGRKRLRRRRGVRTT